MKKNYTTMKWLWGIVKKIIMKDGKIDPERVVMAAIEVGIAFLTSLSVSSCTMAM